ncbi:LPXTG cell wall anchor domain-containing protein [Halobacillus sp. B23F22_1]|uniref:LPXTG cell wall anchor domain-containing protein n=1 Tax=Halobacillus sp. B23F22_1 TaxID=3459514 RepID=UPI00373EE687
MKKLLMVLCSVGFLAGIFLGSGVAFADHSGDKNCGDFETGEEVMEFWESHDYSAENDPSDLDRDSDGQPCESLTDGVYENYNGEESSEEDEESSDETEEASEESDEDADESAAGDGDDGTSSEEGGELPDTATNQPFMMLMGALITGAGGLLVFRKKSLN